MAKNGEITRVHVRVQGRVQGVFYRASCREEARVLGLTGWVRNCPDGSVELEAQGPRQKLERLIEWCRHGPPAARVDNLEFEWIDVVENEESFRIR